MGDNTTTLDAYGKSQFPKQRSGRIFLLYSGQHYDAIVAHACEKPGGRIASVHRMFPIGVSEMSSLAMACGIVEYENLARRDQDGLDEQTFALLETQENWVIEGQDVRTPPRAHHDSLAASISSVPGAVHYSPHELHSPQAYSRAPTSLQALCPRGPSAQGRLTLAASKAASKWDGQRFDQRNLRPSARATNQLPSPKTAEPQSEQESNDVLLEKYLLRCRESVQSSVQGTQKAEAMSQEEQNMMMSLKLAAQLTEKELEKVQEKNKMPLFDPYTAGGLG